MKATKELIDALMDVAFGNKDLESQMVRLNNLCVEADKETLEFEAKAAELDRREQGVEVLDNGNYCACGKCGFIVQGHNNFCRNCGTKLIWPDN